MFSAQTARTVSRWSGPRPWRLAAAGLAGLIVASTSMPAEAQRGPESVAPLAKRLSAAVVNISTSQIARGTQGVPLPNVPKGSPFEEFFEDFFEKRGGTPRVQRNVSSLGSGFVIDGKEGLVVTNNHVIADADEIIINFQDGTKLKVDKVLGRDPQTDLALLKVSPKNALVQVNFGSSEKMEVGDWVMAIGNPFGLGGSVSLGIISAKQRDINSGPYDDFLQTDAAINKGNSGGPLFNMDGDVIGVNTAIISPTGGSIGIGFSVPSDSAKNVVDQLRRFGRTRRGWLGVKIQTVTDEIAETLGLDGARGALVASVTPASPAAKGGLQPGDVILRFDTKDVTRMRGLPKIVAETPAETSVPVEVLRRGETTTLDIEVGLLKEAQQDSVATAPVVPPPPPAEDKPKTRKLIGMELSPLTKALRKKFSIADDVNGVVVVEIDDDSRAARKGMKIGDVIVEAGQKPIDLPDDVSTQIDGTKAAGRKAILFRVEDGTGALRFVAVPFG